MHDINTVECLATRNNLLETLDGKLFRESRMQVQKVLKTASVGELKNAVIVGPRLDHLLLVDDVRAVNHG